MVFIICAENILQEIVLNSVISPKIFTFCSKYFQRL